MPGDFIFIEVRMNEKPTSTEDCLDFLYDDNP